MPFGSYVKPLGMAANAEERSRIAPEDQPYAFFNKPGYLRIIILLGSPVTIAVLFFTTYIIGIATSAVPPMDAFFNYIVDGVRAMFTSQVSHEAFAAQTQQILQGNSVVMIAFLILLVVFYVLNIGPLVSQLLSSADGEVTGARRIVMIAAMLVSMWLALWKVPVFIFSFFFLAAKHHVCYCLPAGPFYGGCGGLLSDHRCGAGVCPVIYCCRVCFRDQVICF